MAADELDPTNTDRDRGILTKRERRYLLGESDIEPKTQGERAVRQSIRNHLTHAILDFSILQHEIQPRDLSAVFESEDSSANGQVEDLYLHSSTPDVIGLLYRHYGSEYHLEKLIKDGIERERERAGESVIADVSVNIYEDRLAKIENRLQNGDYEAIDIFDIEQLWRAGELTDSEYLDVTEQWKQWWEDERKQQLERDKGRRQMVQGALDWAKQSIKYAQEREESRQDIFSIDTDSSELTDATVETMVELDDGDGVDVQELVTEVIDRRDVSEEEAEQAVQDALLTGRCFEPEDGVLQPT